MTVLTLYIRGSHHIDWVSSQHISIQDAILHVRKEMDIKHATEAQIFGDNRAYFTAKVGITSVDVQRTYLLKEENGNYKIGE